MFVWGAGGARCARALTVGIMCGAAVAPATLTPDGAVASTFPGINGRISFSSDRTGVKHVYSMNPDGTGSLQLTSNAGGSWNPSYTASGSRIAYDTATSMRFMNADGTNNVLFKNFGSRPSWSPDETKIAYDAIGNGKSDVYVISSDGLTAPTNLTNGVSFTNVDATWSPDGTKIAFMSDRTGSAQIFVMNANGSSQAPRTSLGANFMPVWSPDGSKIAFVSNRDGNAEIYSMNADGTGQVRLTARSGTDYDPAWSPDGARIAFSSDQDGDYDIYVMNANGSGTTQITNAPGWDERPDWQAVQPVRPANDNFANAQVVGGYTGTVTGTNVNATSEPGEPLHAGLYNGTSVWYSWTAPASETVTMDTFGTNFDPILAVYTGGSVGSLTEIASNDDSGTTQSLVQFGATAGTTYKIAITGYGESSGNIVLNWSMPVSPPAPSLFVSSASVPEGNAGSVAGSVMVSLSRAVSSPVTVRYSSVAGSASAGSDFVAIGSTTLTFSPGETSKVVGFTVLGDTVPEVAEAFAIRLSSPVGAVLGDSTGTVNILGEEGPLSVYVGDPYVTEGNSGSSGLTFPVSLSAAPVAGQSVSVRYATANGTATAGSDYAGLAATTLTFGAGEVNKLVNVAVTGDNTAEPNETVLLKLSNAVGLQIGDASGTGTILNDD